MLESVRADRQNGDMDRLSKAVKRVSDVLLTLLAGPLLLVITGVIAVFVRLGSEGGAIFAQERAGKDGQPFKLYKFRTMRTDVDPFGASPKDGQDPRLTRVGRWLRTSSLDELPQLWNVLKGDMSLVGPRPLYMSQASEWDERQRRRLKVRPGLTGLAQVSGRGGLTIEEKLELDVQYVEKQSLWLDARIVGVTILQVFGRKGIYEKQYSRGEHTRGSGG